jgi:hypothetical protein
MGHLFISYSRIDTALVDKIVEHLKKEKLSIWIDRSNIEAARQWPEQISTAIKACECFLLIVSSNSIGSSNVLAELNIAHHANVPILPLHLEKISLPNSWEYQLAGIQFLDVNPDRIPDLDRIVTSIQSLLGQNITKKRRILPPPELTINEKNTLAEMLTKIGIATTNARSSLCHRIGIDPNELPFLTGTSAKDFAVLFIYWLDDMGRKASLRALGDELYSRLGNSHRVNLNPILSKLDEGQ